jgi:hypothetical protein
VRTRRSILDGHGLAAAALAIAIATSVACAQLPGGRVLSAAMPRSATTEITQEDLREAVIGYLGSFSAIVVSAADTIAELDPDPMIRRRTLFWKIRMVPYAQNAALLDNPIQAFTALVGVAVAQRLYLSEGDGREIFGPNQPRAVAAAERAEAQLYAIGDDFLSAEELDRLRADAVELMRRRPISGRDFAVISLAEVRAEAGSSPSFDWLSQISLSPFRALEGVGEGGSAIRDFNDTAIRFSAIVAGLPDQVRWQSELLLFDVESRDATQRALAATEALAVSAERLTRAFETLPHEMATLLEQSQGAVAEANTALATAESLLGPLAEVVREVSSAGQAWERVVRGDEADPAAAGEGRPFDVREWEATLRETTAAADALRGLAGDLNTLVEGQGLANTSRVLDAAVDRAAWRGAQLLLGFFALLVAYRLLVRQLDSRTKRVS